MKNQTTVDVIIPTYKPDASFEVLLERLEQQNYPVDHILIMNTEEDYWDDDLIAKHPKAEVFHIRKAEFDHGATRDMGAQFSNADILVYMTQDALPDDRSVIRELVRVFRDARVKAAYARQLPNEHCRILEGYTRNFNYPEKSCIKSAGDLPKMGIKTFFCSNVCAAYDHETYRELGGFAKPSIFNEDMIYAGRLVKLGYSIAYVAEARVIHSHNYTNMQQFHRNFDLAVSQAMHPEIFRGVPSEGEGLRLVHRTAKYLRSIKRYWLLPRLYWSSGCKFLGYRLGRLYRIMPRFLVKACSMNKEFWNYQNPEELEDED